MDRQLALSVLSKVRQFSSKRAGDESLSPEAMAALKSGEVANAQKGAVGDIGTVAAWSLGAGMAARGAVGLYNVLSRNLNPPIKTREHLAVVPVPVEERDKERQGMRKVAWSPSDLNPQNWDWSGQQAATKTEVPWRSWGMLGGGMLAGAAGWKGVDALLSNRREADIDSDVEQARHEFSQAMLDQYERPGKSKRAEDEEFIKLGEALDDLYDKLEKRGTFFGSAMNNYGYYALPAAALAGTMTYDVAKKHQARTVLEKAIKQRARRRQAMQPAELYAVPVPTERNSIEDEEALNSADQL